MPVRRARRGRQQRQTETEEDTVRTWLRPPPGDAGRGTAQAGEDENTPHLAPTPSGIYGVLDAQSVDVHLAKFLTNDSVTQEQPPSEILFIRMVEAEKMSSRRGFNDIDEDNPAPTSSSSSASSGPALAKSQFDWTSRLEREGWHWLWFKYGPALAQLLNTTLKYELAIWMTPQFDEQKLSHNDRYKSALSGPVLFKRKPQTETVTTGAKADSSGRTANLQLAAHTHPLVLYSARYDGSFRCKVCKKNVGGQCYACIKCDWDCCMKCFQAKGGNDPDPKPLPNPSEQEGPTAEDLLYSAHNLSMQPSYKFKLFEHGEASSSSSSMIDDGLLSFHQVLRWLHQQLGSDSNRNFDLEAALKASSDLEEKSQVLRQGIAATLELQYVARLFPEVWLSLHPSLVSQFTHQSSFNWSTDELDGLDQQFVCTMDPTVGLEQVDVQATQSRVQSIQSSLTQLYSAVRSRYHSSSSLRFLPRFQLLDLLKQGSSDQNRLGWNLKLRINQHDDEVQQEQQLVRCNLAILSQAIQSTHLPFSLLAICPDPDPSLRSPSSRNDPNCPWTEFGDGAKYRFNNSSGFFIPSNVNPLEAVTPELLAAAKKWSYRLQESTQAGNDDNGIHKSTAEQLSESLSNSGWAPMCSGDREMKHYNPDNRFNPFQTDDQDREQPVPLHKMALIQPSSKKKKKSKASSDSDHSDCWGCDLCSRTYCGPRYTCVEHQMDICLDCGRESQIKWLQSIIQGFNTHREQSENNIICIHNATMPKDCATVIPTVLERENAATSTSSSSSTSSAQVSSLWFDDFDLTRLTSTIWKKSPTLQSSKPLDAFLVELGANQKHLSQLIHFFHVSNAFKLAFEEYSSLIDTAVERLVSPDLLFSPAGEDEDETTTLVGLYPLHEEIRRLTELPSLSSTSVNHMDSINRAVSSVLRSVHSQISRVHLGWKPLKEESEIDTHIHAQFRTPIVFGMVGYQHNGLSASTVIQQLLPCLARLFHQYYEDESKAGRNVSDVEKIQFWMSEELCLPDDLWDELRNDKSDHLMEGALLLLPPVKSQKLRVDTLPTLQPYHNVTFGNSRYANPDDPKEGHELTLEPVIRAMHRVFRNVTGSPCFDLDAVLRLSAPVQAQSEILERCIRIVESVLKIGMNNPRLNKQLCNQVGSSMPEDSEESDELHGKFTRGLSEAGQIMEELDVDSMRNQLKPFEQFTRLHVQQLQEQREKKKERSVKRKHGADEAPKSSAAAPAPVTLPASVLSFTPTAVQTQQISSILSSLDTAVKNMDFAPFDDATRIPSGGRLSLFRWKKEAGASTIKSTKKVKGASASSSSASSSSVATASSSSDSSSVASDYQWLILIERVLWSQAGGWIGTEVSCHGSEGAAADRTNGWTLDFLGKSVEKLIDEGQEINPQCHKIQLQGKAVTLQMDDPEWFEQRGVELENEPSVTPEEFCRACFGDPLIRPLLFCSDAQLQSFCVGSNSSLRPLLQLYDWNHPSGYSGIHWEKEKERQEENKPDPDAEMVDAEDAAEDEKKDSRMNLILSPLLSPYVLHSPRLTNSLQSFWWGERVMMQRSQPRCGKTRRVSWSQAILTGNTGQMPEPTNGNEVIP